MTKCPHDDVRYFADSKGAIACMDCGRLFGHLSADDVFVPHNPNLAGAGVASEPRSGKGSTFATDAPSPAEYVDRKTYRVGLRRGNMDTTLWKGRGFANAQEQQTAALGSAIADDFVFIQDMETGYCRGYGI